MARCVYEAILWRKNRWEKLVQSFYRIIPHSIFPSALSGLVCKDANDVVFIASLRGDYSSLITFTVRKFYWCSNCFSLPDFTPLLPVVNSCRQFWIVPLLPGCSEPSNTQVFLLIFHRSPSKWWAFGPWRASKLERSIQLVPHAQVYIPASTHWRADLCVPVKCTPQAMWPPGTHWLMKCSLGNAFLFWLEEKSPARLAALRKVNSQDQHSHRGEKGPEEISDLTSIAGLYKP